MMILKLLTMTTSFNCHNCALKKNGRKMNDKIIRQIYQEVLEDRQDNPIDSYTSI